MFDYKVISGDSHLDLAPDRWTGRVPAKWRDRAPRRVQLANGEDGVIIENRPVFRIGFTRMNSVPTDQWHHLIPTYEGGHGTGSPEQRLHEQDQDGVDAEALFAHSNYVKLWRGIKEDEGFNALVHAYNEFLIEEYAAPAPHRLIVLGVIPPTNIEDALRELAYCHEAGFKGVALYRFPNGSGQPKMEDDRFWQASLDLNMPVSVHASTNFEPGQPALAYSKNEIGKGDPIETQILRFASDQPYGAVQLMYAGVFDRFPSLRIYWAETQCGWLAHSRVQIDENYDRYKYLHRDMFGLPWLNRRPSEYLRENNLFGFLGDPFGVRMRHEVGIESIMWGSDFAHAASNWPHSLKLIEDTFGDISAEDRYQLIVGNAVNFWHLDAS